MEYRITAEVAHLYLNLVVHDLKMTLLPTKLLIAFFFFKVLQTNWEMHCSSYIPQLLKPFPSAKSRPQGWGTSSSGSWSSGIDGSSWVGTVSKELRVPELEDDWLALCDALEEELVPLCDCWAPWDCCTSFPVSRDMLASKRTFKNHLLQQSNIDKLSYTVPLSYKSISSLQIRLSTKACMCVCIYLNIPQNV